MAQLKRVQVPRERASFPAVAAAFLVFSIVFYLAAQSVQEEKTIVNGAVQRNIETREMKIEKIERYLIALCKTQNADEARITGARYMQRGAAGYVWANKGHDYSIGHITLKKEEADRMCDHLKKNGIPACVIPISAEGATLRITADQSALTLWEYCFHAFSEFENRLLDYAQRLDAGDLSEREARVLLSVLAYDLSGQKAACETILPGAGENAAKEIFALYLDLLETASALTQNTGGELMLSARIKYAAIDNAMKRIRLLSSLSDQI